MCPYWTIVARVAERVKMDSFSLIFGSPFRGTTKNRLSRLSRITWVSMAKELSVNSNYLSISPFSRSFVSTVNQALTL